MATMETDERYHVVCRHCTTESVFDTPEAADRFAKRHADETGHPIAAGRVV